jgi:hypothetical protein
MPTKHQSPEFKPQNCKKKKKRSPLNCILTLKMVNLLTCILQAGTLPLENLFKSPLDYNMGESSKHCAK